MFYSYCYCILRLVSCCHLWLIFLYWWILGIPGPAPLSTNIYIYIYITHVYDIMYIVLLQYTYYILYITDESNSTRTYLEQICLKPVPSKSQCDSDSVALAV